MIILENISLFKLNCRALETIPVLHFRWRDATFQIETHENKFIRFGTKSKIKVHLHTFYTLTLLAQAILTVTSRTPNLTTAEKLVDMTGIVCILVSQTYFQIYLKKHKEMALLVNWIFGQRNSAHNSEKNGKDKMKKNMKIFYKLIKLRVVSFFLQKNVPISSN